MKNTYLANVWRLDKKLAGLISLFILGQAFFSYKQVETLPFFNYGMYARPMSYAGSSPIYRHYQLYDAQEHPLFLQEYSPTTFLEYQLSFYYQLKRQQTIDAALKSTIHQRFYLFPLLEQHLLQQLCNHSSTLPHAQHWLKNKLNQNELYFWEENYVWVKNNFELLTKNLVK